MGENVTSAARQAEAARAHGIVSEVIKLAEAKHSFVLPPRTWMVEHSFAWMAHCRRLARDGERSPETLAGFYLLPFVIPMLRCARDLAMLRNSLCRNDAREEEPAYH